MTEVSETFPTDALGDPIVIGARYGYSRNSNGFTHVTLGTAKSVSDSGKARLVDCEVKNFVYGKPCARFTDAPPADVSVLSTSIFPVPAKEA